MRLRGALLGAGNIALRGHAPQWAGDPRLKEELEIVAVADLHPSNLDAARAFFPDARTYEHAEDLLAQEDLDFCDVCTPPFTHRALVESATGRRLHVVCEKPLASTVEDAEVIARVVREARVVFQPCHQYRFAPQWEALRRMLPRIGRVYLAEYDVHRTEANPGNPHWAPAWRTDRRLAGGGILVDHGAHIFYQLRAVLGEPQTVQAVVRTLQHSGYEVEDTALVTLDFGQCLAQVNLTWAARRRAIQYRFVGESGEIVGNDEGLRVHAESTEEIAFHDAMSGDSSHSGWYAPLLREFTERVQAGDLRTEALDEAVYVTRLTARAYESSAAAQALPLVELPALREAKELEYAIESTLAPAVEVPAADVPGPGLERDQAPPVSAGRRRRALVLRGSAAAAILSAAAWTFHDVAWGGLWRAMSSAKFRWIAAAALVNFAVLFFQSARWLALVRPMSRVAGIGHALRAIIMGYAVSTVVPARAGELARLHWFGRETGLSRVAVFGSIILDQLVNAVGLLVALALLPFFFDVPLWLRPGGGFALTVFVLVAMVVVALRPAANAAAETPRSAERLPVRGFAAFLASVRHGLGAARNPKALGLSLGASFVAWALEVNVTALSLKAVGLQLPLTASILVLIAVNLALAIPFAPPGNMGTLEVGATLALMDFGVPKEQALAFALCYHFLQVVPIGAVGLILAGRAGSFRHFGRRPR